MLSLISRNMLSKYFVISDKVSCCLFLGHPSFMFVCSNRRVLCWDQVNVQVFKECCISLVENLGCCCSILWVIILLDLQMLSVLQRLADWLNEHIVPIDTDQNSSYYFINKHLWARFITCIHVNSTLYGIIRSWTASFILHTVPFHHS